MKNETFVKQKQMATSSGCPIDKFDLKVSQFNI